MDCVGKAKELFENGYNCCQAIVLAFSSYLSIDKKSLESISSSFGGGVGRLREVCGCVSGMCIVMGLLYGDYDKLDNVAKSNHYKRIQDLTMKFKEKTNSYLCHELLNLKKGPDSHIASLRTKTYYDHRPCVKYIECMAKIILDEIKEHEQN